MPLRRKGCSNYIRPNFNNASYFVDRDKLECVFGQKSVVDLPVAVYALAGAFRKGKSFMLNFFLRYLRATVEGKVAVFLMDTQGTFDHESSVAGYSIVFALSMLFSSVQIYNVMQQIQEDALQHLQLFTEYGKAARQSQKERLHKPFQDLLFLVRDWSDPDISFGFEGGNLVLSKILEVQRQHKDLESVRQNIYESFTNVKCFLMPPPGRAIALRGAQTHPPLLKGNIDRETFLQEILLFYVDVDKDFLASVNALCQEMLCPVKLIVKVVNGKVVNGKDLINFSLSYCNVFESGKMPEVGTILQATAKASMLSIIKDGKIKYNVSMYQISRKVYTEPESLDEMHEQHKQEALKWYDNQPKLCGDRFIEEYRSILSELVDQQYALHKQTNMAQRERLKPEIRDVLADAAKIFVASLESVTNGEYLEEKALVVKAEEAKKEAADYFEEKTRNFPQKLTKDYKLNLLEINHKSMELLKQANEHLRI